jgi:NAD(P)-dependent dehydrogenase (short-subunit alcohol dehydrogenase family)
MRLAREGAKVVVVDVSAAAAQSVTAEVIAAGGAALGLAADVASPAACEAMVAQAVERFGRLTTLVNSAGVRSAVPGPTPPLDDWQRLIDINLSGSYFAARAAIPAMVAAGGGAVVHLASIFGLVGGATGVAYAAAKGGIVNLTRQMALEWAPKVRVNCVCPGVIETPMTQALRDDPVWAAKVLARYPLGRFGMPEDIAAAILYLASDEASFVTGVALPVDGGYCAG